MITSGLVEKLIGKGIEDLAVLKRTNRKVSARQFGVNRQICAYQDYHYSDMDISLPVLEYSTNESWPFIDAIDGHYSAPLLLYNTYAAGKIYILVIPDNYEGLYHLPPEILNVLRDIITPDFPVQIEGRARIGLFVYDNDTFIVESFLPYNAVVNLKVRVNDARLRSLTDEKELIPALFNDKNSIFSVMLEPGSYQAFKIVR